MSNITTTDFWKYIFTSLSLLLFHRTEREREQEFETLITDTEARIKANK